MAGATSGVLIFFFFQAEDGIRDLTVTGVQTCALPISVRGTPQTWAWSWRRASWGTAARPRPASTRARAPVTWLHSCQATGCSGRPAITRSEEHTSELQSQSNLVCRLLLEKKKKKKKELRCKRT